MLKENTYLIDHLITTILIIVLIPLSYMLFTLFKRGPKIGQILSVMGILTYLLAIMICLIANLSLEMNSKGIMIKYPPFLVGSQVYYWKDIRSIKIIKFNALAEFGGWGKKHSAKYGDGYLTTGGLGGSKSISRSASNIDCPKNVISLIIFFENLNLYVKNSGQTH